MSAVQVTGLCKDYGATPVLCGVDLHIPDGSVLSLLGPSGCGKTTLLRLIAGFEPVDAGRIAFGSQVVATTRRHLPPERRGIGYVPQEGALFPHLTVAGNVAFGLRRRDRSARRIAEVLALVGLERLGERYPHELSGGQQQRVALARALAPDPALVLLDEPFNALDLDLRRRMSADVADILRRAGTTAILVTHDPGEAFAVSDQLAVMQAGRIMQCAAPEDVYWQATNAAVARLTGSALVLPCHAAGAQVRCALGTVELQPAAAPAQDAARVMIRPEQVRWNPEPPGVAARVVQRSFRGDHSVVELELGELCLRVRMASLLAPAAGASGYVSVRGACMAWAAQNPRR